MQRVVTMARAFAFVLLLPAPAFAQASITGVVRDASGGLLPGVTVEAASPALTERVRAVQTDGTGQYRIVDLPPGSYTLTFNLTGFAPVHREGILLTGTFTATVNAELRIGALAETVTVTGESPIVDVQSARRQQVIDGQVLQSLPTSRSYNNVLQLVPAVTPADSGQVQLRPTMILFSAHGGNSEDGRLTVNGINVGSSRGGSGVANYVADLQGAAEVTFQISGNLGEAESGGPQMGIVPRTGSNRLTGTFFVTGVNRRMQGSNWTEALRRAGLTAPAKVLRLYDIQGSVGGPIRKDRLWYYFNWRDVGSADAVAGVFANKNAGDPTKWTYEPDYSRQARNDVSRRITALRTTIQATSRNKFDVYLDNQPFCNGSGWTPQDEACRRSKDGEWIQGGSTGPTPSFGPGPSSPETGDYNHNGTLVRQLAWQSPVTSRLLLDARWGAYTSRFGQTERPGNPTRGLVRVLEQGGQFPLMKYRSSNWPGGTLGAFTWNTSVTYVTGAHSLKLGYQGAFYRDDFETTTIQYNDRRLAYRFNNVVPNQITQATGPWTTRVRTRSNAFYGQEQWTHGRLTLQGALRFDRAWSVFPEQRIDRDVFVPNPIVVAAADGVTGYNDFTTRTGFAYDLFGDGKTSLKVNVGKYLWPASNSGRYTATNPATRLVTSVTRGWNDANRDYIPQCDLSSPAGNGECGAWDDQNFGRERPGTAYDPAILGGWGVRPSDWQFGASVQRELLPRTSVEVGYYRRWWQHYSDATDNLLVSAADFDRFAITAPSDPRLPDGGGYVVDGLYDINPNVPFGLNRSVVKATDSYSGDVRYWDGVDVSINARLTNGLALQGGTSTGRLASDLCGARSQVPEFTQPNAATGLASSLLNPYCRTVEPFLTQVRAIGSYVIPRVDVQVAGTFQSRPGVSLAANLVVPNAVARQSLGRNLSGNVQNVTVNLLAPNTMFGDRLNQLDVRIAKILRFSKARTNLAVDIVNALNSSAVLTYNNTFNATWPTPATVLTARLARLSVQFDF
jgi:hypothetical protein